MSHKLLKLSINRVSYLGWHTIYNDTFNPFAYSTYASCCNIDSHAGFCKPISANGMKGAIIFKAEFTIIWFPPYYFNNLDRIPLNSQAAPFISPESILLVDGFIARPMPKVAINNIKILSFICMSVINLNNNAIYSYNTE